MPPSADSDSKKERKGSTIVFNVSKKEQATPNAGYRKLARKLKQTFKIAM